MIQDEALEIPRQPYLGKIQKIEENQEIVANQGEINFSAQKQAEDEITQIKRNMHFQDFQKMLCIAEKDLDQLQQDNYQTVKGLYQKVQDKFQDAIEKPRDAADFKDTKLYKPEEIYKYGLEFMDYVDPGFVQDMITNKGWYHNQENINQFLLNINYPCKLQTDFLKELELSQQRRNEVRYRKIMDQLNAIQDQASQAKRKELENGIKQLSLKQRAQIAQDDACCAICGVGDYEDDDQIVFCVRCSMPVHQSCFGLEQVPEIDWVCNNCAVFGFQRGQMVKCFLCPKRGGAMKPTNIFGSYQKFYDHKIKTITKKTGKHNIKKISQLALQTQKNQLQVNEQYQDEYDNTTQSPGIATSNQLPYQIYKNQTSQRYENNVCLTELLQRESLYKRAVFNDYLEALDNIKIATEQGHAEIPELTEAQKLIQYQEDEFEFNFNKHERTNHSIPEDYCHFLQRNETLLESCATPVTDTLYHWAHHSCSMWMPGPVVTPRQPVKMNKLDFSKFNHGCVICGKKGVNVGAVVKCHKPDCDIKFHVECAKRTNYCMEIEKKGASLQNREKIFKIYCESHRPFKIIQEINDQNAQIVEDIQKFTRTIDKCLDAQLKHQQKPKKMMSKSERSKLLRAALQNKKQELLQLKKESKVQQKLLREQQRGQSTRKDKREKIKSKKWKEKDKKALFERVKEKYLQIKKMRVNMIRVDPMITETKRHEKELKRIKKVQLKRQKMEIQMKQKQFQQELQKERDVKSHERGLRQRSKLSGSFIIGSDIAQSSNHQKEDEIMLESHEQLTLPNQCEAIPPNNQNQNPEEANEKSLIVEDQSIEPAVDKTADHKMTLNFARMESTERDGQPSEIGDLEGELPEIPSVPQLQQIPIYYKFAAPMTVYELEWTVTLSRYDFPWHEICFSSFTAKECYKQYTSQVKDISTFLKRVLGEKPKYQKMIQNQLQGLPTIDYMVNVMNTSHTVQQSMHQQIGNENDDQKNHHPVTSSAVQPGDKYTVPQNIKTGQQIFAITQEHNPDPPQISMFSAPIVPLKDGGLLNTGLYCHCKGRIQSDFMVACETGEDECPNGGWVHPQCTQDLNQLSKDQIDLIEIWYCTDCDQKRNPKQKLEMSITASPKKQQSQQPAHPQQQPQLILQIGGDEPKNTDKPVTQLEQDKDQSNVTIRNDQVTINLELQQQNEQKKQQKKVLEALEEQQKKQLSQQRQQQQQQQQPQQSHSQQQQQWSQAGHSQQQLQQQVVNAQQQQQQQQLVEHQQQQQQQQQADLGLTNITYLLQNLQNALQSQPPSQNQQNQSAVVEQQQQQSQSCDEQSILLIQQLGQLFAGANQMQQQSQTQGAVSSQPQPQQQQQQQSQQYHHQQQPRQRQQPQQQQQIFHPAPQRRQHTQQPHPQPHQQSSNHHHANLLLQQQQQNQTELTDEEIQFILSQYAQQHNN